MMDGTKNQSPTDGKVVARRLIKAIDRANPPGKVWIGTASTMIAVVAAFSVLFRMTWLKDALFRRLAHTGMVLKPGKKTN